MNVPAIEPRPVAPVKRPSPILRAFLHARLVTLRMRGINDLPMPLLPREGFSYWCDMLRYRVQQRYDAVIMDTGPVGSSKSTLALRIGQELDPVHWTVPPDVVPADYRLPYLCYSPQALLNVYRVVKPCEVVIFDEGVRGLLAGDQMTPQQKALIQAFALVREKGAILIICAPRVWLIAKQIRQGRATLWIQVLRRGLGLVHIRDERLRYEPDNDLPYERAVHAPYLEWAKFEENDPLWVAYLAEKHRQLDEFLADTIDILNQRHRRETGHDRSRRDSGETPESVRAMTPRDQQNAPEESQAAESHESSDEGVDI